LKDPTSKKWLAEAGLSSVVLPPAAGPPEVAGGVAAKWDSAGFGDVLSVFGSLDPAASVCDVEEASLDGVSIATGELTAICTAKGCTEALTAGCVLFLWLILMLSEFDSPSDDDPGSDVDFSCDPGWEPGSGPTSSVEMDGASPSASFAAVIF
jgi:hypothetical protein